MILGKLLKKQSVKYLRNYKQMNKHLLCLLILNLLVITHVSAQNLFDDEEEATAGFATIRLGPEYVVNDRLVLAVGRSSCFDGDISI